ncbi:MAG: phage portal protein [Aureibaculum sp.]|nr:phage portal protein [Aureibaculum sp.]
MNINSLKSFVLKRFTNNLGKLSSSNQWYSLDLFGSSEAQRNFKYYTDRGYGENPYLFMVVNKISNIVSGLNYELVDPNNKIITSGPEYDLLKQPNTHQTFKELVSDYSTDYLVTGNGYLHGMELEGMGMGELKTLRSKQTSVVLDRIGEVEKYVQIEYSKDTPYLPDTVNHIKTPNIVGIDDDEIYGLSPVEILEKIIEASNQINIASAAMFKNKGVIGILTNRSDVPMLRKDRIKIQKELVGDIGGAKNYNGVGVSNQDLNYIKMGMTPTDMKMIEQNIEYLRTICSVYGLDSSLFNDPANKTYNNRAEAQKAAYTDVFIPVAEKVVLNTFNEWLLKEKLKSPLRLRINKDNIEVLSTINADLTAKVISELNAGILTAQEAKEILYPNE